MRTLTGKLENVEYFDTSLNGNSRYMAHINGVQVYTGVDSSLGYALTNYRDKNVTLQARIIRGKLTIDGRVEELPEHPDAAYFHSQFTIIYADMDHIPTLKIHGKAGATNHLNVTLAQLKAIEEIMCNPVLAGV